MNKCIFGSHKHAPLAGEHHYDHSHSHGHDHDHEHSHDYRNVDKRVLGISLLITFSVMILEVVYGLLAGSLALISDAVHMFTHSFALAISYAAIVMASKKAPADKTFGYHRMEVLAAFVNAVTIGLSVIWILYEAVERFISPQPIDAGSTLVVAVIGLVVNIVTGVILMKGDMDNVNLRSAFLHMMADALSSVAIVGGIVVIYYTGWSVIDPIIALLVAFVIARWSFSLFKSSVNVLLEASPVDINELRDYVTNKYESIVDMHDVHVWEITHRMYCMSAHIGIRGEVSDDYHKLIGEVSHDLEHKYKIGHVTLQPEWINKI